MTGKAALEQTVIALGIKQPVFIKSGLLETVVHICSKNEIILIFHQRKKLFINWFRSIHVSVYVDIPAPECPVFLQRFIGVKSAGVHIRKMVFSRKIRKILPEPFPGIDKTGRRRQPSSGSNDNGIGFRQFLPKPFGLPRIFFFRLFIKNRRKHIFSPSAFVFSPVSGCSYSLFSIICLGQISAQRPQCRQ